MHPRVPCLAFAAALPLRLASLSSPSAATRTSGRRAAPPVAAVLRKPGGADPPSGPPQEPPSELYAPPQPAAPTSVDALYEPPAPEDPTTVDELYSAPAASRTTPVSELYEAPDPAAVAASEAAAGAAAATATATATLPKPAPEPKKSKTSGVAFASGAVSYVCPRCRTAVTPLSEPRCPSCSLRFSVRAGYLDMVAPSGPRRTALLRAFTQSPKQAIFQNPAVSFAYERGWRAQFAAAGFPGVDAEFALLEDFLLGAGDSGPGAVLDLSCGSGLMARKLAASGLFLRVVAVDLSDAMLREALRRAEREGLLFDAVRADITRLPFADGSVPYVHAGAALHCWDRLQDALAEVHRVMAPGGRFLATTFLKGAYFPAFVVEADVDPRLRKLMSSMGDDVQSVSQAYRFFDEEELVWLARVAGFTEISVERRKRCAILRCTKPE
jgi:ubiquinone/menaquinone biosynthesis C-methylase UbiE/DNA-directed RNA polymerase subunit RPC12/RpoP